MSSECESSACGTLGPPSSPTTGPDETGAINVTDSYIYATLRYDPKLVRSAQNAKASFNHLGPFYLLEHQWTRMQVADWCSSFYRTKPSSNAHNSPAAFYNSLVEAVKDWYQAHPAERPEFLRLRVRSYLSGRFEIDPGLAVVEHSRTYLFPSSFGRPDAVPPTEWTVVVDVQPTEVCESTMYKTSNRAPYARPRVSASIPDLQTPKEVLLFNPEGAILDGSQSTPYFYRNGRWVVPSSSSGGQQGVTRRWALENGLAVEGTVSRGSLRAGEIVWLSNGVWGFYYAQFVEDGASAVEATAEECRRVEALMRS